MADDDDMKKKKKIVLWCSENYTLRGNSGTVSKIQNVASSFVVAKGSLIKTDWWGESVNKAA